MLRFSRADLEAVVGLLAEACELEGTQPFPDAFLERLNGLLHAHVTSYCYLDRQNHLYLDYAGVADIEDNPELEARYWDVVHECPTFNYRERVGDPAAVRMTDLVSRRAWHRYTLYNDYFRPYTLEHIVEVGLPAERGRDRFIVIFRHPDAHEFSERDRDLLELLRPHLARMRELAKLRAHVAAAEYDVSRLTPREQEILDLVAEGKTNAEIAALLWVAPSTIKKHLENVYEKLGVRGRAAAVTRVRAG
jgi:DNA-binding CsgD family transcriptional regulator